MQPIHILLFCFPIFVYTEFMYRDSYLNGSQIIRAYGYYEEDVTVETQDGHLITAFRLYNQSALDPSKYPILMQHGMTGSGDDFVCNEYNSPAFHFADLGYEVWLPNNRGTRYSLGHKRLSLDKDSDSEVFWNFTLEHLGTLDTPAVIDKILSVTKKNKVIYIGHTEGTTQIFAGFSLYPQYFQQRLHVLIAWSPITSAKYFRAPALRALAVTYLGELFYNLGFRRFFPYFGWFNLFAAWLCKQIPFTCYMGYRLFADVKPELYEEKAGLVFMGHFPAGTSLKSLIHLMQLHRDGGFNRFKESEGDPIIRYPLENVKGVPIAIMASRHGGMSGYKDAEWLRDELRERVGFFEIYENMADMTFDFHPRTVTKYLKDTIEFIGKKAKNGEEPYPRKRNGKVAKP